MEMMTEEIPRRSVGGRIRSEEKRAKFAVIEGLIASGKTIVEACKEGGLTYQNWYYYKFQSDGRKAAKMGKKSAPRIIKEAVAIPAESYNKSLRARIMVLEKLVVELSLDRQALMEAREGAV